MVGRRLLIWGAGGHARVVADVVRCEGRLEIAAFLDDVGGMPAAGEFEDAPLYGSRDSLETLLGQGVRHVIVAIGDCRARQRCADLARQLGFTLETAIHPMAVVASDVTIGDGSVVAPGAIVCPGSVIGENVIINTSASVDHESVVGDGAHVSVGVRLGGKVSVGPGAFLGMGAVVLPGVRLGAGCVVGAGSVVLRDVPNETVVYGVPARAARTDTSRD